MRALGSQPSTPAFRAVCTQLRAQDGPLVPIALPRSGRCGSPEHSAPKVWRRGTGG